MGMFGCLLQAAVNTVCIPVAVVQDVVEPGKNKRTKRQVERIGEDIDDLLDGR